MVAKHFGKNFSLQRLRDICGINKEGVSLLGISEAAEKIRQW
ncbi:cysteine peptidase family C39 domain-containing protein [Pedobacter sp. Du54]